MGARRGLTAVLAIAATVTALLSAACSDAKVSTSPSTTAGAHRDTTTTAKPGPLARYAGYHSVSYDDPAHWICRPGRADTCAGDLDSTTVNADGTLTVEPFVAADDPPVDCFYVYPTISRDPGAISDWNFAPDQEDFVTFEQAARLRADCRVFAPGYRQRTLASLGARITSGSQPGTGDTTDPYADVLDAWKTYMAEDNNGRGVVLIGHSQGAALLSQLIAQQIDPNPDVRSKLVAVYLAGWAVSVPHGKDVGGDYRHVPLCHANDQSGCVVTWASFRSTAPLPADSFFGKPRSGQGVAGCTNPASLRGGSAELHSYFPSRSDATILTGVTAGTSAAPWLDPKAGTVTTPFVSLPGLVTGKCVATGGFDYFELTVHPSDGPRADDIRGDLTPQWGMHLVDVNVVMGDVVGLVDSQAASWLKSH